jgi:23S rRNA pseudouridine1911/1915/1917 synthase
VRELIVPPEGAGQRLDSFLRGALPELGRRSIAAAISAGHVRIDGARVRPAARLREGQRVALALPHATEVPRADPSLPLAIVHEDASLVIVDKPAGMPCHPLRAGEPGTLVSALLARYPEIANFGYSRREPGIVHRLDTQSSGLVLCARSEPMFLSLRAQLEQGAIDKRYFVLCSGGAPAIGEHHAYLAARGPQVRVVFEPSRAPAHARPIVTEVLRVAEAGAFQQVELRAHRAARHQVRAHLAALGHPLVGDVAYGGAALASLSRHCLHASAIELAHPESGLRISVRAALPSELRGLLPDGCVAIVP